MSHHKYCRVRGDFRMLLLYHKIMKKIKHPRMGCVRRILFTVIDSLLPDKKSFVGYSKTRIYQTFIFQQMVENSARERVAIKNIGKSNIYSI